MRILTKKQAKELDLMAMVKEGIPGEQLMGNAGMAIAKLAEEITASNANMAIAVVCGKGNNGGDGFAAAQILKDCGRNIDVYSLYPESNITGDAKTFYSKLIEAGQEVQFIAHSPTKNISYSLIIDAVLGTGVRGELQSEITSWIRWMDEQNSQILSADIPSGLHADTGLVNPICVTANKTVTIGYPKIGMLHNDGPDASGEIVTADIGFPNLLEKKKDMHWSIFDDSDMKTLFPKLPRNSSKHSQGKVLLIAGSKGMTGAAVLAGIGAMRTGAGLVKACVPESLNTIFETKMTEVMTIPCEDHDLGRLQMDNIKLLKSAIKWCDCVVIGPGIGNHSSTKNMVEKIVVTSNIPMVIDADALEIFYDNDQLLSKVEAPFIITPHCGELSKILKVGKTHLENNFPEMASNLSKNINGVLVAKNAPTITLKGSHGIFNPSGNSGLSTGGTGDVLSGMLGSLMAQGFDPFIASQIGVFLHGKAADICARELGQRGMIASDLLNTIPKAIALYE
mgnify:CR=1 FL=1